MTAPTHRAAWLAAIGLAAGPVAAQEAPSSLSGTWTNFLAWEVEGSGDTGTQPVGGKLDLYGTLGGDRGLWQGASIGAHAEAMYGQNVTYADPDFIAPPNTALYLPSNNEDSFDLSLALTQRFGDVSLTLGKINMIDNATRIPIRGGGGREGFQHLQFAAPVTNFTPPSVWGAILSIPTERASFTLGVWDSESAVQQAYPENHFASLSGMVGVTIPVSVRGLPGWQALTLQSTTERQIDLADLPYLALPPDRRPEIDEADAGWTIQYTFQQYLWQDSASDRGWGVFGQANAWDGNPTITDWAFSLGVAGTGPLASRPEDAFGLGYFILSMSDTLIESLEALDPPLPLRDEQGAEAFYTWQVGERWRLTANAQVIEPGVRTADTAVILGLRALVGF